MTTHILALTYAPKIAAVKSGECRQTIRRFNPERPKKVGDKLILHTWGGKPYRSKWDWRLETEIKGVDRIRFGFSNEYPMEISFTEGEYWLLNDDQSAKNIAINDGIENPSLDSLLVVLGSLNGVEALDGTTWEVIRW